MTDERPDGYEVGMVAALGTRISDAQSPTGDMSRGRVRRRRDLQRR
jgi:hypothetical protein